MYDRGTVDLALRLSNLGILDRENADICGVSVGAIRHWRYGRRRNGSATPRTDDGRVKRDCPRCHGRELDHRAYAYLLGLYLGDGHIAATTKGCFRLSISCSRDWPGIIDAAEEVMAISMPRSKVRRRARGGCVDVLSQSKHWPCVFPQHGPGMKHTRKIELAPWQRGVVDLYTEEFVRGLVHSDGCRSMNRVRRSVSGGDRWYEYPRYLFTNESADIKGLFTDALDRLGIAWKRMNRKTISVARRDAVARLDEFVGPKY